MSDYHGAHVGDAVDSEDDGSEDYLLAREYAPAGGRRRAKRRGMRSCLGLVLVFALVMVGGYFGLTKGVSAIQDQFGEPADFSGPGTGQVSFEVHSGDGAAAIGRNLKDQGVVASVDAFTAAASGNPDSAGIQVGYYDLRNEMRASDALAVLVDPANLVSASVTIPEGARVGQIVTAIVDGSDLQEKKLTKLLDDPSSIGLPPEADGNIEGYLFPATYSIDPSTTAKSLLTQMVAKTAEVEAELDVAGAAAPLDLTPHQVITVASILEYEANNADDYAKVARVIYNRLDADMPLQMDSTVSYVSKREGDVWTTAEERDTDSQYNTYKYSGLPPGPIGSPGKESIEAALNPAEGDWLYFVPDFESGTTLFTSSYSQHLANVAKAKAFCQQSEEC